MLLVSMILLKHELSNVTSDHDSLKVIPRSHYQLQLYKSIDDKFDAMSNEKLDEPKIVKVDCSTQCDDLI